MTAKQLIRAYLEAQTARNNVADAKAMIVRDYPSQQALITALDAVIVEIDQILTDLIAAIRAS